jgi:hypothetical protein
LVLAKLPKNKDPTLEIILLQKNKVIPLLEKCNTKVMLILQIKQLTIIAKMTI